MAGNCVVLLALLEVGIVLSWGEKDREFNEFMRPALGGLGVEKLNRGVAYGAVSLLMRTSLLK